MLSRHSIDLRTCFNGAPPPARTHRRSHPLRLHTMPQPARGPPTGPRTGGPWSSGPVLGPRGTVGPPYGPKDRGPLVLRAGGGTSGRSPAVGPRALLLGPKGTKGPPSPLAPGPRGSSGQGRALCQTGYSVVCSRGVGTRGVGKDQPSKQEGI